MAQSTGFIDQVLTSQSTERYRVGISLIFLVIVGLVVGQIGGDIPNKSLLMAAAVIAGYMAINIGANDVANNVGPAVGSGAMSLFAAVMLAAVFSFLDYNAGNPFTPHSNCLHRIKKLMCVYFCEL